VSGQSYVALGDSYSAGFGVEPFSATSPFTAPGSDPVNGCYQALQNYPHLAAGALGLVLDDQTCSGAVTANITTTPQVTMAGYTVPQVQLDAVTSDTDIITLTIGGNDLGFATVAEHCIRLDASLPPVMLMSLSPEPQSCEEYYTSPSGTWTGQVNLADWLADTVVPALDATFAAIKAKAPDAKVYVIGYPQIATQDPAKAANCFSDPLPPNTNTVPFGPSDIVWLGGVEESLDDAIEAAAHDHGFYFVPTWDLTADHTLCDAEPWIGAMTIRYEPPTCDPDTEQALTADGFTICLELGALHPNVDGVSFLASQVQTAIQQTASVGFAVHGDIVPGGTITVSGTGFDAFEEGIQIFVNSTPVLLATVAADSLGSFSWTGTLPTTLSPGAHSISITRTSGGVAPPAYGFAVALPPTGTESGPATAAAIGALVLGALALGLRDRFRRERAAR